MRLVRRLIILLVILCFAGCSKKATEEYAVSGERTTYVYTSKTVEFFELDSFFILEMSLSITIAIMLLLRNTPITTYIM